MTQSYGTPPPVLLGTDIRTGAPVCLPYEDRPRGVSLIGKAGEGKSTVLENLIFADIEEGTPGLVIDPHGLLTERIMQLTPPEYADRIILLEADQSAPFGLNLLDVRKPANSNDDPVTWASDSVVTTIKKLYGQVDDFFPRLERWLDVAVRTLIPNNGTLADVVKLFRNEEFRRQCLKNVDSQSILDEWSEYDSLRSTDQITYIEAVVNRLGRMLRPPLLQSIIGSKKTTVPFDEVLYGDKMLLVSLPSERLSQERCDFIGSLVLHVFADLVFSRKVSVEQPPRVHVYVDEYQRFASSTTNALIEQGRKYGVGLTIAHQTLQQIPELKIRSASYQAGTLIVLGTIRSDAEELAGEFPVVVKQEWTERITEVDGEEPEMVPTAHPVDHLFTTAHVDPRTDRAARLLLAEGKLREVHLSVPSSRDADTGVERAGFSFTVSKVDPTRPMRKMPGDGWLALPLSPYKHHDIDAFLVRAMQHRYEDSEHLAEVLVESGLLFKGGWDGFFSRQYRGEGSDKFDEEKDLLIFEGYEPWIHLQLKHREQLKYDHSRMGLFLDDYRFIDFARSRGWEKLNVWKGPVENGLSEREPVSSFREPVNFFNAMTISDPDYDALQDIRERLAWLVILCDGLAEKPILVPSGQMRLRMTTRLIHHPKQAEQDAINEFTAKFVNPKRKYVAHVKLRSGYHETLLRPPLDEDGVNTRTPNPDQPDDIRRRSRTIYDASAYQDDTSPQAPTQESPKRNINRRPLPQDTEPEE